MHHFQGDTLNFVKQADVVDFLDCSGIISPHIRQTQ